MVANHPDFPPPPNRHRRTSKNHPMPHSSMHSAMDAVAPTVKGEDFREENCISPSCNVERATAKMPKIASDFFPWRTKAIGEIAEFSFLSLPILVLVTPEDKRALSVFCFCVIVVVTIGVIALISPTTTPRNTDSDNKSSMRRLP